jgi:Trk K+ transport system NAD-binding subunit
LVSDRAPPSDDSGVEFLRRRVADGSHVRSLAEELPDIDVVVAVGPDEEVLLIGYLARREFDACLVVAGITDPRTESAFEDTGVDTISLPQLLADGIRERYRLPRSPSRC